MQLHLYAMPCRGATIKREYHNNCDARATPQPMHVTLCSDPLPSSAAVTTKPHWLLAVAPGKAAPSGEQIREAPSCCIQPGMRRCEADPLSGIHCLGPPRISSYVYMQHLPMAAPPHAHVGSPCLRAPGKPWLLVPKLVDGAFLQARQRICQASRAPGKVDQHLGCQPTGLTAPVTRWQWHRRQGGLGGGNRHGRRREGT
mmetsp:Transcript_709/g.1505  ORF Transcript_709/g.1505 Transcript_709/m.1505 type:complete len:200 (-) Transcript_709:134-733(-)